MEDVFEKDYPVCVHCGGFDKCSCKPCLPYLPQFGLPAIGTQSAESSIEWTARMKRWVAENSDDTEQQVINDILARQQTGIQKYGTTLASNPLPLREWLEHAYLECLDQALYLKRAIMEMDK